MACDHVFHNYGIFFHMGNSSCLLKAVRLVLPKLLGRPHVHEPPKLGGQATGIEFDVNTHSFFFKPYSAIIPS